MRKRRYSGRRSASRHGFGSALPAFLIVFFVVLVFACAVIVGNVLKNKTDDAQDDHSDTYIEPAYELERPRSDTKNVCAYMYTFGKDISGYISDGITDVSVALRGPDGDLTYSSDIADAVGWDADTGFDLRENVEYIHKSGGYMCGFAYIESFSKAHSESFAAILRTYEKELVCEAADCGVDEIMLVGIDIDKDNTDSVLKFISDIKKQSVECRIGISVSYDVLLTVDSGAYICSRLATVADIIALDTDSVPCLENMTEGEINNFSERIGKLHYFTEAYRLRFLFSDDREDLYSKIREMNIANYQIIKAKDTVKEDLAETLP